IDRHLVVHGSLPPSYLYIVKIWVTLTPVQVKRNLYTVKIATYKWRMARKAKQNKAPRPRSRSAAKPAAAKQAVRRTRAAADSPYHHGAL
ncbi:hypothetical protein ABTE92_19050, partial [Acinetobacter baumannii]